MGKLDDMRRAGGAAAAESVGVGVPLIRGGSPPPPPAPSPRWDGVTRAKAAALIPVERIAPDPDQPREEFDGEALARLAESLRSRGQIQPIRVRWDEGRGAYLVVCGERRWRAAKLAGLPALECVVADGPLPPDELLAMQLVENLMRADLKPVERARGFRSLMDRHGWSTRRVADELAVGQARVVESLALLDLPEDVRGRVERGELPPSTAYEISKLPDPAAQAELAAAASGAGLTRSEVADAVRAVKAARPAKPKAPEPVKYAAGGDVVTVRFGRGSAGDPVAALRRALKSAEAERKAVRDAREGPQPPRPATGGAGPGGFRAGAGDAA